MMVTIISMVVMVLISIVTFILMVIIDLMVTSISIVIMLMALARTAPMKRQTMTGKMTNCKI